MGKLKNFKITYLNPIKTIRASVVNIFDSVAILSSLLATNFSRFEPSAVPYYWNCAFTFYENVTTCILRSDVLLYGTKLCESFYVFWNTETLFTLSWWRNKVSKNLMRIWTCRIMLSVWRHSFFSILYKAPWLIEMMLVVW
jgi:hypothetical protein